MKTKTVTVVPYDEQWPQAFDKIKAELIQALANLITRVEHVGSTSVAGLWAKPVIDIDVVIADMEVFPTVVDRLAAIGYVHEGDLGINGREAFKYAGKDHLMKHHLYVCPENSQELKRHLTFRDYLRTHPEAVQEYSGVKRQAAQLYPQDIDKYIEYKSPCIEKIYRQCGLLT